MELETINKLYLELSQIATAKTAKEIKLEAELHAATRVNTPDPTLPALDPDAPKRDILIRVAVAENFEKRLDNQYMVEREIHADRWQWEWATPNQS